MSEPKDQNEAACGGSDLTAELGDYNPLIPAFEAMLKDAERYRWLRNLAVLYNNVPGVWMAVDATPDENNYLGGRELDAAVDAAMKAPNNEIEGRD